MATVGTTTDSYNAALAQAATYLSGLGDTTAEVSDVGRLWSFLLSQANATLPDADTHVRGRCLPADARNLYRWPSIVRSYPR